MSPESPRFLPEAKANDNQEKKSKFKKRAILPSSLVSVEQKPQDATEKPQPARLNEALANLLKKERDTSPDQPKPRMAKEEEASAEPAKSQPPETAKAKADASAQPSETSLQSSEQASTDDETDKETPETEVEVYERQEKQPNQIGIEGLLTLDSPEVQVIPLHGETTTEAPAPRDHETTPEEAPAQRPQPEHQPSSENAVETGQFAESARHSPETDQESRPAAAQTPEPLTTPETIPEAAVRVIEQPEILGPSSVFTATERTTRPPELVTKEEADDRVYRATKIGQNRGVIAGLLVGGWYEHRKHKRHEKRQEKQLNRLQKSLAEAQKDTATNLERHRSEQAATNQRLEYLPKPAYEALPQPEKQLPPITKRFRQEVALEQLQIPDDHRIETSAWHSIEVDAKTGKAVEKPTFQYGHEYYRERAKEAGPVARRNVAAGEVALVAAAVSADNPASSPSASQANDASGSNQDQSNDPLQKAKATLKAAAKPGASGPMWPWLVALFVIAICLIALIH